MVRWEVVCITVPVNTFVGNKASARAYKDISLRLCALTSLRYALIKGRLPGRSREEHPRGFARRARADWSEWSERGVQRARSVCGDGEAIDHAA